MEKITLLWQGISQSQLFLLSLTVIVYYLAQLLRTRVNSLLLNPVLLASLFIIIFIDLADIEFESYYSANEPINFLLGVSVVCLGYLMYENFANIKEYKISIIIATFAGSLVGVLSVIGLCFLFGCDEFVSASIQPKSVTTAIALSLSESLGGMQALTALSVSITGISGSVLGPQILSYCGIKDRVARGVALGSCAHAIGTARALELGALEGAVGGAAIGLMGLFTSFIIPFVNKLL